MMAACCGKSKTRDGPELPEDAADATQKDHSPNDLSLSRVHAILDRMSKKDDKGGKEAETDEAEAEDSTKLLQQSVQIKSAVQVAAALWGRDKLQWPETKVDRSGDVALRETAPAKETKAPKAQTQKHKELLQRKAYIHLKQADVKTWLEKLRTKSHAPNAEQFRFLEAVARRCCEEFPRSALAKT